jgi:septum formation protein
LGDRKPPRLILASASPRRRTLLRRLLPRFRIIPADLDETVDPSLSPAGIVRSLALQKALAVAGKLPSSETGTWVLGADTLVFLGKQVLGKPDGAAGAREMLGSLSGQWHSVYTGVALVQAPGGRRLQGHRLTRVRMKRLSPRQIAQASRRHLDKAGAYAIQESGDPFVESLKGDYDNVVGLPMGLVKTLLRRAGLIPRTGGVRGFGVPGRRC